MKDTKVELHYLEIYRISYRYLIHSLYKEGHRHSLYFDFPELLRKQFVVCFPAMSFPMFLNLEKLVNLIYINLNKFATEGSQVNS